jgi:hypothetical protein
MAKKVRGIKRQFGRPKHRSEGIMKVCFITSGYENVDLNAAASGSGPVAGSCEHSNEYLSFMNAKRASAFQGGLRWAKLVNRVSHHSRKQVTKLSRGNKYKEKIHRNGERMNKDRSN